MFAWNLLINWNRSSKNDQVDISPSWRRWFAQQYCCWWGISLLRISMLSRTHSFFKADKPSDTTSIIRAKDDYWILSAAKWFLCYYWISFFFFFCFLFFVFCFLVLIKVISSSQFCLVIMRKSYLSLVRTERINLNEWKTKPQTFLDAWQYLLRTDRKDSKTKCSTWSVPSWLYRIRFW